jgi:hypothetical protein
MANFILNNTASDINDALQKVITPDTEPQLNDNLITSGGVKTYVDGAVGDFAGKTVTTEATGIENTDNDTSIPTSAAVKDYVDASNSAVIVKSANYKSASGNTYFNSVTLPVTEVSDPSNIGSVNSGTVTLAAGTYLVAFSGGFAEEDGFYNRYNTVQLRHNGVAQTSNVVNETGSRDTFILISQTILVSSNSSQTVDIRLTRSGSSGTLYWSNANLIFIKLA